MEDYKKYLLQKEIFDEDDEPLDCETILSVIEEICKAALSGKQIKKISFAYWISEYEYELMKADDDETADA